MLLTEKWTNIGEGRLLNSHVRSYGMGEKVMERERTNEGEGEEGRNDERKWR